MLTSMSVLIYTVHKRETSNALYALLRSEHEHTLSTSEQHANDCVMNKQ